MSYPYLRELIEQGSILTAPVRPANSADYAAVRAHLRDRRAARRVR
jgi:hypothetical protein